MRACIFTRNIEMMCSEQALVSLEDTYLASFSTYESHD